MTLTANFALLNTTKGALRYQEVDNSGNPIDFAAAVIGSLYVRKSALPGKEPKTLSVTVKVGE